MRRYQFALEPVLRVRRIQEDVARARLVAATVGLAGAETVLQASLERYAAPTREAGVRTSATWLADRDVRARTAASVAAASAARDAAERTVVSERGSLQAARSRVTGLERLDGRHRAEHAVLSRRDEDVEVDEQVSARHGRAS